MKKEKKEKKEKVEKKSDISALSGKMDEMIGGLNILGGAVTKLVELQTAEKEADKEDARKEPGVKVATPAFTPKIDDETYPQQYVPAKYRAIVTELLSEDFGVTIVDFEDRTDFQVNIIVPERYSSVTKEDREKGVEDVRSRMVARSMGENGVREWCSLIRQNLNKYYTQSGKASPFTS